MTEIKIKAKKIKDTYKGYIEVYENNRKINTTYSPISRLTKVDAMKDASILKIGTQITNHI